MGRVKILLLFASHRRGSYPIRNVNLLNIPELGLWKDRLAHRRDGGAEAGHGEGGGSHRVFTVQPTFGGKAQKPRSLLETRK